MVLAHSKLYQNSPIRTRRVTRETQPVSLGVEFIEQPTAALSATRWREHLGPVPDSCSPVNVNVPVPVPEMRNGVSGCADREGCSSITNDWTSMS